MNKKKIIKLLEIQEDYQQYAYDDATGKPVKAPVGKLTIGYGYNLQDRGMSKEMAYNNLSFDVDYFEDRLKNQLDFFESLDEVRKAVLISMAYNLGMTGFLEFKRMIDYMDEKAYVLAGSEMLKSKWATQVKSRSVELAEMMVSGQWPRWLN